jgi:hypothetical protein
MSELDAARAELVKQEESLSLLTARLVYMSTALDQITDAYASAEEKDIARLEEQERPGVSKLTVEVRGVSDQYRSRIDTILYK